MLDQSTERKPIVRWSLPNHESLTGSNCVFWVKSKIFRIEKAITLRNTRVFPLQIQFGIKTKGRIKTNFDICQNSADLYWKHLWNATKIWYFIHDFNFFTKYCHLGTNFGIKNGKSLTSGQMSVLFKCSLNWKKTVGPFWM